VRFGVVRHPRDAADAAHAREPVSRRRGDRVEDTGAMRSIGRNDAVVTGLDVTWPVAPGCLSRPTGLRRRGAPHPGSHSGGTPSFARATDLGLPKTLGRLGKGSVIGFPNPRESSRPAVTTM